MHHDRDMLDLARRFDAMFESMLRAHVVLRADLGISEIELRLLRALREQPQTVGALARAAGCNRSSTSMAAQRLEQRGLVSREVTARQTTLELTGEARRQLDEHTTRPAVHGMASWLDELEDPTAGIDAAQRLLSRITEAFDHAADQHATHSVDDRLHASLRRGDVDAAYQACLSLVHDGRTRDANAALARTMHRIGDDWSRGDIEIFDERVASSTAQRVADRLHSLVRPASRSRANGLRAFVVPAVDEQHELAVRVVANELEILGWHVDVLTGPMPPGGLAQLCSRRPADAVFISVTRVDGLDATARFVESIATHACVFVGGQALQHPDASARLRDAGATRCLHFDELDLAAGITLRAAGSRGPRADRAA